MNKINILSSDFRYDALFEIFIEKGYDAHLCTVNTVDECDILILPIKSALTDEEFSMIFHKVKKGTLVFSGEVDKIKSHFNGRIINYSKNEDFIDKNAYITAECALIIALMDTKKTAFQSSCCIIGYGRIGKHLTDILLRLGANVTVLARREESRALAREKGALSYGIEQISQEKYDIIFNTVPRQIITADESKKIFPKAFVYDLASLPGGFEDESFPKRALALPGKMMPISAGKAIFDFVVEYISNERK